MINPEFNLSRIFIDSPPPIPAEMAGTGEEFRQEEHLHLRENG
jgi:hypothetical protein